MTVFGKPYILGGAILLAFSTGWKVNDWRHSAALKVVADKIRAEEQVKLDNLRGSLNIANTERLALAADLANEKANTKIKYRTITQEVPAHAPRNNDACNYDLSPGLIGLLNSAARGGAGYPAGAAEPTGQRSGAVPDALAGSAD